MVKTFYRPKLGKLALRADEFAECRSVELFVGVGQGCVSFVEGDGYLAAVFLALGASVGYHTATICSANLRFASSSLPANS